MTLINDLLDIEKMKGGKLELSVSAVNIAEVFQQSLQSVSMMAAAKKIRLTVVPTNLFVDGDEGRLVQVVVNLLANAVKFTPENENISMSARDQGRMVEVSVRDSGRGIPEDQLSTIFDRFTQVKASDAKQGGSGLGLAICKALVELHGGKISVESRVGVGTSFSFTIPKAQVQQAGGTLNFSRFQKEPG